jgi:MOSC domain-containing protein YiiM
MREVAPPSGTAPSEASSFTACVATILELDYGDVPVLEPGEELPGWRTMRWLGGLGIGLVRVGEAATFEWAGPWIGLVAAGADEQRAVVMFGVPSGVAWDPTGVTGGAEPELVGGFVLSALDVASARPSLPDAPSTEGTVTGIYVAPHAGEPAEERDQAHALPGSGLEGDRHTTGDGTFPSGLPGSALTLIEAEVCESFDPPLDPSEHRRNVVTRGIDLNALVGHEFAVGEVRCRGMRLCEPCTVVERYSSRPVLRALVHRGGLRADILTEGLVRAGDSVRGYASEAGQIRR